MFFLKNKLNFYFNFNFLKLDVIKEVLNFNKNNIYLFKYNFYFVFLKLLYTSFYSFYFFNQKLNLLLNNNYFYKNIFLNFNKNSLFFYNCINSFITNNFFFYKFINEGFIFLFIKNFKKLNKHNNLIKLNKKYSVLFKINNFKLTNFNKKLKLINDNTMFYYFLTKIRKPNSLINKNIFYFKKFSFWFFYSNIYTYIFKNNLKIVFYSPFYKNHNNYTTNSYYYNFFINFFSLKNKLINYNFNKHFIFPKSIFKNFFFYKINFIFYLLKYVYIKKTFKFFLKNNFYYKFNKFFNNKFRVFQNYILYKHILKSILILNDSIYTYNYNYNSNFFFSNFYLFNFLSNYNILTENASLNKDENLLKQNFYNNHYPMFFLKSDFIDFFLVKIKKANKINTFKYIQFYITGFFEHIFKKKIFLKILNNSQLEYVYNDRLEFLFDEFKFYQLKIIRGLYVSEILEALWLSFQNKDVSLLMIWLKKRMEKIHFKNHKKFLNLLKMIVTKYSHIFLESFKLKGFFFDIRGKVGVGGNSKKRHFFFRIGKINLSSKNTKLDHQQNIVNTSFGALGVTMILSY